MKLIKNCIQFSGVLQLHAFGNNCRILSITVKMVDDVFDEAGFKE
jgi:hypothetical protein